MDHLKSSIGRGTVDDQVDDVRIVLYQDAVEGTLKHLRSIVGNGDVDDTDHRR